MPPWPAGTVVRPSGGTLYLDLEAVQPCDVLLELGTGVSSELVAVSTGGPFSHAALIVNRYFLFESEDLGVGYTPFRVERVERVAGIKRVLSNLTTRTPDHGVEAAVLLRHPDLTAAQAARDDLGFDLEDSLSKMSGYQYPEWRKLASAFPGGWASKKLARVALSIRDAYEQTHVWKPGLFCSQLVAAVLQDVLPSPLTLFSEPVDSSTVNPNSFLSSNYAPVAGAVRQADRLAPLDDDLKQQYDKAIGWASRVALTKGFVDFNVGIEKNKRSLEEIERDTVSVRMVISRFLDAVKRVGR